MFGVNRFRLSSLLKAGLSGICLVLLFASCASGPAPAAAAPRAAGPEWIRAGGTHERFDSNAYMTAVGHGTSRQAAEASALGQLVMVFGTDIEVSIESMEIYRRRGDVVVQEASAGIEVALGAGMANLIGTEIGDRWDDGRGNFVAFAVMNRERAARAYSDLIRANLNIINNVTNMTAAERNSLSGFSRYRFAAAIADMNVSYAAVLSILGMPAVPGVRNGDHYRLAAMNIANSISVGINVDNDRAGRLRGAFASAFTAFGLRTDGANQPYVLEVSLVVQPTEHAAVAGRPVFVRMELAANLINTNTGAVLLPYTFNVREGHTVESEANNRAFMSAERRINSEYRNILTDHLTQLIPRQ